MDLEEGEEGEDEEEEEQRAASWHRQSECVEERWRDDGGDTVGCEPCVRCVCVGRGEGVILTEFSVSAGR